MITFIGDRSDVIESHTEASGRFWVSSSTLAVKSTRNKYRYNRALALRSHVGDCVGRTSDSNDAPGLHLWPTVYGLCAHGPQSSSFWDYLIEF